MKDIKNFYDNAIKLFSDNYVVNWHEHVWESAPGVLNEVLCERLYEGACDTYMDKVLISDPITSGEATPERFHQVNNVVVEGIKRHPDKFIGMCFVNGGYKEEAVEEVKRCIDMGFVGVKLYHQYFINDHILDHLVEECIKLDVPILVHAGRAVRFPNSQPFCSDGAHFADMGRRYPEANIIMAHIGGGGDWQWQIKAIADVKNIFTDMSGSVVDAPMIENAVKMLVADRILFGTDGTLFAGIGKMLAANISEEDKKTILSGGIYDRFLKK